MTKIPRCGLLAFATLGLAMTSGCTPKLPAIVPVSGTVYLDGKPLAFANIEFVPELRDFGAESNSTAVTDEEGHYSLVCSYRQQPGAVVATHHVLVMEHIPDEMRGMQRGPRNSFPSIKRNSRIDPFRISTRLCRERR